MSSSVSSFTNSFSNSLSNSISYGRDTATSLSSGLSSNSNLYIGLLIVIIVCVIVAYLLYIYIGYMLFSKFKTVIPDTKIPIIATKLTRVDAVIDKTANGYRRSFSFWIYINDMNKYKGQFKHVLSFSSDATIANFQPAISCSPCIYLDQYNNSMFIRFNDLNKKNSVTNIMPNTQANNEIFYKGQGVKIDYIPLQRWVHVAIVCNSDRLGPTIYTYIDGEIVSSSGFINNDATISSKVNIDLNTSGNVYIGGSDNLTGTVAGFSGLVAKVTTYNHDINQQDVYNDYNSGPMSGFLAQLGLGMYGIRNPIYKKQ